MLEINNVNYRVPSYIDFKLLHLDDGNYIFIVKNNNRIYKLSDSQAKLFRLIVLPNYYYLTDEILEELKLNKDILKLSIYYLLNIGIIKECNSSLNRLSLKLKRDTFVVNSKHGWLIGNFHTCSINYLSIEIAELLLKGHIKDIPDQVIEKLFFGGYIQYTDPSITYSDNTIKYENYIVLTYKCNLACSYCFEKQMPRKNEDMSLKTLNNILYQLKDINENQIIVLYGGEPLLLINKNHIWKIIQFVKENENCYLRIITNGINVDLYLSLLESIKNKIISFTITVDGNQSVHDSKRCFANGGKTYEQILHAIKMVVNNNYNCIVRINLDNSNYDKLNNLIGSLNEIGREDLLSIFIDRVENPTDSEFRPISLKKVEETYNNILKLTDINIISNIPIIQFLIQYNKMQNNNLLFFEQRLSYCQKEKINVFDCDGKIYCCNESMGDNYFLKDFCDNKRVLENTIYKLDKCEDCLIFPLCLGNCPRVNRFSKTDGNIRCEKKEILEIILKLCSSISNIDKIE